LLKHRNIHQGQRLSGMTSTEPMDTSTEPMDASVNELAPAVTVRSLRDVLTTVRPIPADVRELKVAIEEKIGMPRALQKLVKGNDAVIYADEDKLEPDVHCEVLLLKDETPLWTWDAENNPAQRQIEVDRNIVKCPRLSTDYVNVITKEPVQNGIHYFEFLMHYIGDEQSCGLVSDPSQAGPKHGLRYLTAWTYYVGRMGSQSGSLRDGKGALHAQGKAVKEFQKLRKSGDTIGMLVDLERGAVAFSLNGDVQGACAIPKEPLWVITHVDTRNDVVELRKPCLDDAPPAHLEALQGALIDISKGEDLSYSRAREPYNRMLHTNIP